MKKTIKLSESDLHRVIKESVKRYINEGLGEQRNAYEELVKAIENMMNILNSEFVPNEDQEASDVYTALETALDKTRHFFQHPEFSPGMVWDGAPSGY